MTDSTTDIAARSPRPNNYTDTTEFWTAVRNRTLVVQYDSETGQPQWFPRSLSMSTGRRQLEWRPVSGRGTLYSWTVTESAWPGHEGRVPYVCALIDLEEGVRMLANVVGAEPDSLTIGQPVEVVWEDLDGDVVHPAFRPR